MPTKFIRPSLIVGVLLTSSAIAESYRIETVVEGLQQPWSLAFLPDGDLLVTELPGRLRRITAGAPVGEPVRGTPETYAKSQGGYFDVLPHPDFGENRLVYLSYAEGPPDDNTLAIGRGRLQGNGIDAFEVIFRVAPRKDTPVHYGGRMVWLGDGTLLVTTGDGFNYRERAQYLDNQMGKTVRMTDGGAVPEDNPFTGQADKDPYVYTYGHRNAQGLVYDAERDRVFLHEHGPRGGDELNLLQPGRNYGWPAIGYGIDYTGAYVSPYTEAPGLEQPLLHWTPSIAPSGMAIYRGDAFPDWRGSLFVGALVEKTVRRIELSDTRIARDAPAQTIAFAEIGERIRDVREGPDGLLYLLTAEVEGRILRVTPVR